MAEARQKEMKVNITVVATKTLIAGLEPSTEVAMLRGRATTYQGKPIEDSIGGVPRVRAAAAKFINFAIGGTSRELSRLALGFDEPLEHGSQLDFSLSRARLTALEFNPAFVEAIEHLNAGHGVLHALRFEQRFPSLAWHRFYSHRTAKQTSKSGCDLIRGDTMRPFQLDHPSAIPLCL